MYKVLFVCTGNICRSPSADAVFRHVVKEAGLDDRVMVDSAGTHGYHIGHPPDPRSIATAEKRGYSMNGLAARKVVSEDFDEFDLILAMDQGHYDILQEQGQAQNKGNIQMFLDYAEQSDVRDVPDPYYGDQAGFEYALDLVEDGARGLLNAIKEKI